MSIRRAADLYELNAEGFEEAIEEGLDEGGEGNDDRRVRRRLTVSGADVQAAIEALVAVLLPNVDGLVGPEANPEANPEVNPEAPVGSEANPEAPVGPEVPGAIVPGAIIPLVPAYVGLDNDAYMNSDAEEFNQLDDLFELFDSDRVPKASVEFPKDGAITLDWCISCVNAELDRMVGSECYKRRTLSKLLRRVDEKTRVNYGFYRLMCDVSVPNGGESLDDWMTRLMRDYSTSYLKLCIMHYVLRDNFFSGIGAPELDYDDLPGSLRAIREHVWEFARGRMTAVLPALHDTSYYRRHMTDVFRRVSKPLYRLRLLGLLGEEARSVRMGRLCLRRTFGSYLGTFIESYLVPSYLHYPVRGPFRSGFQGASLLRGMYGAHPNPHFYYCDCVKTGSLCGHLPLSVRCRGEYFYD